MLPKTSGSMPLIFLITDGAVEDERHICNVVEGHLRNRGPICPCICTFGIGIIIVQRPYILDLVVLLFRLTSLSFL